jgi:hypothetical protein
MLTRLSRTISRLASPYTALLLFLSLLPFTSIFFPWRSHQLADILGYSARTFDAHFPYTPQQVHQLADDLGESGRRLYALTEVTLDLAFPILYTTWLSITLAWTWRALRPAWVGGLWPVLLPYLGMLGDYAENTCVVSLLLLFPLEPAWLVWLSNLASLIKWSAGLVSLGMILAGVGFHLARRFA